MPHPGWLTVRPRRELINFPGMLHALMAPTVEAFAIRRTAVRLRLWLRRAIRRINDRTVDRIVQMVGYKSLRALYNPISIVELE